jgi:hypothetical protein
MDAPSSAPAYRPRAPVACTGCKKMRRRCLWDAGSERCRRCQSSSKACFPIQKYDSHCRSHRTLEVRAELAELAEAGRPDFATVPGLTQMADPARMTGPPWAQFLAMIPERIGTRQKVACGYCTDKKARVVFPFDREIVLIVYVQICCLRKLGERQCHECKQKYLDCRLRRGKSDHVIKPTNGHKHAARPALEPDFPPIYPSDLCWLCILERSKPDIDTTMKARLKLVARETPRLPGPHQL